MRHLTFECVGPAMASYVVRAREAKTDESASDLPVNSAHTLVYALATQRVDIPSSSTQPLGNESI